MLILTGCLVTASRCDGGVLGEDGDAALAFEVVGIHDALDDLLVLAEGVRLAQQAVHEGGLAVVNVGDDGDVTEIGSFLEHILLLSTIRKQDYLKISKKKIEAKDYTPKR